MPKLATSPASVFAQLATAPRIVLETPKPLIGIFTDGDLRRTLASKVDLNETEIQQVMTKNSKTIHQEKLAAEALQVMEENAINGLVIIDENGHPIGALNMYDLLKAGVV
mgnify:CR=1 FL=1